MAVAVGLSDMLQATCDKVFFLYFLVHIERLRVSFLCLTSYVFLAPFQIQKKI